MAADLNELIPEFRANVTRGLAALADEGLPFKPYFTLRDPVKQAGFWRQSRSKAVVDDKLQELTGLGCDFIVDCFEKAGPQNGPRVTGALPGESWHQWGEAVDCFLEDAAGNAIWESPKYARFGTVGDSNGMWWGGHFNDNDHWQHRRVEPPDVFGDIKRINDALRDRWGDAHSIQPAAALAPAGSGYRPDPSITGLLGGFAGSIPTVNPNRQAFVHPPRFLGEVQSPGGRVLVVDSALELDTDGWIGGQGDPDFQSGTSLTYADGRTALNANAVPYFVLPLPTSWSTQFGIRLGDYAAVLFRGRLAFAVFGDLGPRDKIGEGSLMLLRQLGQERLRPNGTVIDAGTEPGVLTIVFPGSGASLDRVNEATLLAAIEGRGRELFAALSA